MFRNWLGWRSPAWDAVIFPLPGAPFTLARNVTLKNAVSVMRAALWAYAPYRVHIVGADPMTARIQVTSPDGKVVLAQVQHGRGIEGELWAEIRRLESRLDSALALLEKIAGQHARLAAALREIVQYKEASPYFAQGGGIIGIAEHALSQLDSLPTGKEGV